MNTIEIQRANKDDLSELLRLYTQLHDNPLPEISSTLLELWNNIMSDKNHYILVGKINKKIVF